MSWACVPDTVIRHSGQCSVLSTFFCFFPPSSFLLSPFSSLLSPLSSLPFSFLSFSFLLFFSFSLSLFLSFSFSPFLSFSFSPFLSFSLSLFLSFSLSPFLSISLSLYLSISLSLFLSFSLSLLSPFLPFSLSLFLSFSLSPFSFFFLLLLLPHAAPRDARGALAASQHSLPPRAARGSLATASLVLSLCTCHVCGSVDRAFGSCGHRLSLDKSRRHPTLVHSYAKTSTRLRSCIVGCVVLLVRTLVCSPAKAWCSDTPVRPRPSALTPAAVAAASLSWLGASWSVGTYRRRHVRIIDQPTHLVEPSLLSSRACAVCSKHVRRRVHGRLSRLPVGEVLSELISRSCSVWAVSALPSSSSSSSTTASSNSLLKVLCVLPHVQDGSCRLSSDVSTRMETLLGGLQSLIWSEMNTFAFTDGSSPASAPPWRASSSLSASKSMRSRCVCRR